MAQIKAFVFLITILSIIFLIGDALQEDGNTERDITHYLRLYSRSLSTMGELKSAQVTELQSFLSRHGNYEITFEYKKMINGVYHSKFDLDDVINVPYSKGDILIIFIRETELDEVDRMQARVRKRPYDTFIQGTFIYPIPITADG